MIPHTRMNDFLAVAVAVAGYLLMATAMIITPPRKVTLRGGLLFTVGLAVFAAATYAVVGWMPDSTFHCVKHCFPWGD